MCEEFGCLPSQLEDESPDLLMRISALRQYATVKHALDTAQSQADVPRSPMTEVWERVLAIKLARQTEDGE